jgi:hypothetical protein
MSRLPAPDAAHMGRKRERSDEEEDHRNEPKEPETVKTNKVANKRGNITVYPKDDYNMGYSDVLLYRATGNRKLRKGKNPDEKSTFGTDEQSIAPTEHVDSDGGGTKKYKKRRTTKRKRRTTKKSNRKRTVKRHTRKHKRSNKSKKR